MIEVVNDNGLVCFQVADALLSPVLFQRYKPSALQRESISSTRGCPHKGLIMRRFDIFVAVILTKLVNKIVIWNTTTLISMA